MNCPACDTLLGAGSTYCSKCGAPIEGLLDRDAETELAAANLDRVRGNHPDAEAACVRVLRRDPNNVHAHSLLGDIYRDQNRFEEARQWYRMALDLNSESKADRFKLEQVERQLSQPVGQVLPRRPLSAMPADSRSLGTQNLLGLPPQWWMRCWLVVGAVFIVLTVVFLVARRQRQPEGAFSASGTISSGTGSGSSTTGLPSPAPRTGPPTLQRMPSAGAPPFSATTQPPAGNQSFQTPADEQIKQRILDAGIEAGVEVTAVAAVSRDRVMIILALPAEERHLGANERRMLIVRNAFRATLGAFAALPNARRVAVNVRGHATSQAEGEPLFSAEMDRATALQIPTEFPEERFASVFTDIWWAPAASEPPGNSPSDGALNEPTGN